MSSYRVRTVGRHVCGEQGFGLHPEDVCSTCDQQRKDLEELRQLEKLRKSAAGRGTEARWRELSGLLSEEA